MDDSKKSPFLELTRKSASIENTNSRIIKVNEDKSNNPHFVSENAEQCVLGGLLIDNSAFKNVRSILTINDFYLPTHRIIFEIIELLANNNKPFDVILVSDELKAQNQLDVAGGEAYLFELMRFVPTTTNIEAYAREVKRKAIRRELWDILDVSKNKLLEGDKLEGVIPYLVANLEHLNHASFDKPQLKAITLEDFLATKLLPRELILSPCLPKAGLMMIHARPGIGKTHLSFGIAFAVASGREFLVWKAEKPRGVLLIDGEMPAPAAQERWAETVIMNQRVSTPAKLHFVTPDLQEFGTMPDLATLEGQAMINDYINKHPDIELVIVDNLSCLVRTGKENDSESWQPVQTWALNLRARGKSVLFIHHQGKTGSQRGSSKKEDVLDTVIALKRPDDYKAEQGARFIVTYEKSRGFYGDEAKSFEAHLTVDQHNKPCWVTRDIEESTYYKVINMLNDGMSQKEIVNELDIHKSNVSRHAQRAKAEGLLKNGGAA